MRRGHARFHHAPLPLPAYRTWVVKSRVPFRKMEDACNPLRFARLYSISFAQLTPIVSAILRSGSSASVTCHVARALSFHARTSSREIGRGTCQHA